MWDISIPSAEFCCEPKTAIKNKVKKKKKNKNLGGECGRSAKKLVYDPLKKESGREGAHGFPVWKCSSVFSGFFLC